MVFLRRTHVASILVAFVAVAACGLAQSQAQTPEKPSDQPSGIEEKPRPDQRGTATSPLIVQPQQSKEDAARDKTDRQNEARDRRTGLLLNGILILVSLGTGAVVGWQAWEARKAAEAAKSSAETARDGLVSVNRAFVAKEGIIVRLGTHTDWNGVVTKMASFEVSFPNSGATPALDVIGRLDVVRGAQPTHETILGPPSDYSVGYIAPKSYYFYVSDKRVADAFGFTFPTSGQTAAVTTQLKEGEGTYVVGWIAYRDVFDRPHVTQFCSVLRALSYSADLKEFTWSWTDVSRLNAVDDTCPNYAAIVARLPHRESDETKRQT